jgi:uncharacterized protein (TIGR03083 family)
VGSRLDRVAALRTERLALLTVCEGLTESQWCRDSRAAGWTVRDVVAHLGSGCRAMFSSSALKVLCSSDIERTNDAFVAMRRSWSSADVLDEYRCWSRRMVALATVVSRSPFGAVPISLAELGRFQASLLVGGALVFDHHTHLRYDVLPALGLADPGTDPNRTAVVTDWMTAVLSNQIKADKPPWLDRPVSMTLHGAGGGVWVIDSSGLRKTGSIAGGTRIEGDVREFPEWGTRRCQWRDRAISISGDEDYGSRLLDHINVI